MRYYIDAFSFNTSDFYVPLKLLLMLTSSSYEYSDSRMASIFLISFSLGFKGGRFPEDRLVSSVSTKEGFRVSPN